METLLLILRGTALAAGLSGFGGLLFGMVFADARPQRRKVDHLVSASLLAALLLTVLWLGVASAVIAGAENLADTMDALPIVAFDTRFGRLVLLRLGLLAAAWLLATRFRPASLAASGVAVALQAGTGHAAARAGMESVILITSQTVHLLSAGAWLGGLAPLLIGVCRLPPDTAGRLTRGFSPMAFACVLLLAGTGLVQASDLVGSLPPLLTTEYGRMALTKILLFAVLLGLACLNRFVFTPQHTRGRLIASLVIETALGLVVVLVAARLASLQPPTDV